MAITPIVPVDPGPSVPSSSDPETTFDAAYEAFLSWQKNNLQPQINALSVANTNNATEALNAAATAITSANAAQAAFASTAAAANFKDFWSSLTGPLSKPASVKHNGKFWYLRQDLADVTLYEPAENAYWTLAATGTEITQQVTTNTQAISGVHYIITAPGVTITALASPVKGDWFKVTYTAPPYTCYLNFNGAKVRGQTTSGSYRINGKAISRRYQYEDTTVGYV